MKRLFIIRHAKAEEGEAGQSDFDRALTAKGLSDALALGRFLLAEKLLPEKILVSPSRRTQETFSQIALSLESNAQESAEVYNAEFETLLKLIAVTAENVKSLMLVGHNPGMHALAMYFSKAGEEPQNFPPAALLVLDFNSSWKDLKRRTGNRVVFRAP